METKLKTIEDEKDVEIERLKIELANANLKPEPESSSDEEPITEVTPIPTPQPVRPPSPEAVTPIPNIPNGTKVLARLSEEANDGWFYRATIISSEGEKYRVDSGDNMLDIDETDIVKFQGSDIELKVEHTVVAKHPNYQATYAPGVIVKISSDKVYLVRFYDGTEGIISKAEAHYVEPERFEKIVDFILNLEQRWIGETIVARDDHTGIYKLASVKDRLGSGHEYLVEWNDNNTSSIQHLTCIFGKFSKQKTLQVGDHVIGCVDQTTLNYYPGVIRGIKNGELEIQFISDKIIKSGCKVDESFWISKEYFDLAKDYYYTQLKANAEHSDDSSSSDSETELTNN